MPRPVDDEQLPMTSLIDVSFLLIVFFMCLPFRCFDHKLQAFLPRGEGESSRFAEPKETVKIRVRRHGDDISYALGEHSAPTAEGLRPVVRALGPQYAYEIDATATVPWQGVVDMVNTLAAADCKDVRFRGGPPRPKGR
ncbi:MAG: biopolymer transporter ExbD [Planctomycetota bacterium]